MSFCEVPYKLMKEKGLFSFTVYSVQVYERTTLKSAHVFHVSTCAMACAAAAGTRWQAQIKLRWHWDDLRNKERSSSEFKEEPFEQVMLKREQVEGAVRRAQTKLLNPSGNAPAGTVLDAVCM